MLQSRRKDWGNEEEGSAATRLNKMGGSEHNRVIHWGSPVAARLKCGFDTHGTERGELSHFDRRRQVVGSGMAGWERW